MKYTIFTLGLLFVGLIIISSFKSQSNSLSGYQVGDVASDFALKNVNGKIVSLSNFKDAKGFILIFTCNTCPYSIANEERIIALDAEFKQKGYPVVAINPNNSRVQPADSYEEMQKKAASKGFTFPYLFDEAHSVYSIYGAKKTPHAYVLKKEQKKLIVKYIGAIDDNVRDGTRVKNHFLANAVNELLQGKQVTLSETKAIGCGIKV